MKHSTKYIDAVYQHNCHPGFCHSVIHLFINLTIPPPLHVLFPSEILTCMWPTWRACALYFVVKVPRGRKMPGSSFTQGRRWLWSPKLLGCRLSTWSTSTTKMWRGWGDRPKRELSWASQVQFLKSAPVPLTKVTSSPDLNMSVHLRYLWFLHFTWFSVLSIYLYPTVYFSLLTEA